MVLKSEKLGEMWEEKKKKPFESMIGFDDVHE